jgi:hypothetical protein
MAPVIYYSIIALFCEVEHNLCSTLTPTRIYPAIYTVLKRQAVIPRGSL